MQRLLTRAMVALRLPAHTRPLVFAGLVFSLLSGCTLVDQLRRATVHLYSGDVVTISSVRGGDELVVSKHTAEFLVRLLGVQAFDPVVPDPYIQDQSRRATAFLEPWVGRRVHLYFENPSPDPSGRFWAYVQDGAVELNLQMVREGAAPVYTEYPFGHETAYLEVERQARAAAKGIWAHSKTGGVVVGLRRVWRQARQNHHAALLGDPILP